MKSKTNMRLSLSNVFYLSIALPICVLDAAGHKVHGIDQNPFDTRVLIAGKLPKYYPSTYALETHFATGITIVFFFFLFFLVSVGQRAVALIIACVYHFRR
jgi:hypothetical protein